MSNPTLPGPCADQPTIRSRYGVEALTGDLQARGLEAFGDSFDRLLQTLHTKADALRGRRGLVHSRLGASAELTKDAFHDLVNRDAVRRLWTKDHRPWQEDPTEIADRLGWLDAPCDVDEEIPELDRFAEDVRGQGITHAVVLGMGGSSCFPTYSPASGAPRKAPSSCACSTRPIRPPSDGSSKRFPWRRRSSPPRRSRGRRSRRAVTWTTSGSGSGGRLIGSPP